MSRHLAAGSLARGADPIRLAAAAGSTSCGLRVMSLAGGEPRTVLVRHLTSATIRHQESP